MGEELGGGFTLGMQCFCIRLKFAFAFNWVHLLFVQCLWQDVLVLEVKRGPGAVSGRLECNSFGLVLYLPNIGICIWDAPGTGRSRVLGH